MHDPASPFSPSAAFLHRRAVLAFAGAALSGLALAPAARAQTARRIVSLDYGLAETLITLGLPPVGLADVPGWAEWVVEPPLPARTVDVGANLDPNLEVVSALRPDLILTSDYTSAAEPILSRIAPVERISIYAPGLVPFDESVTATRRLGRLTGLEARAEAFLADTQAFFDATRIACAQFADTPLLVVSLMDERHVRVYAPVGLLDSVMKRLGLTNAWQADGGYWGFETVGIERLSEVGDAQLLLIEPVQPDAWTRLSQSPLWQALPAVRRRQVRRLPSVLMFGSLVAARRFAGSLRVALESPAS
ncbi:ABC transporter substrate-binding protein [Aureimonas altamirensis]|uniref:ABC transporter substrate-binding protein n=1 Tax=Aureimonas altamirensis TaxID=370622 RepID=UPI00203766CF|nr:ABC transporter substrate-binding protein [Aureimonas altamirensis]MCM2502676.1 ABC transporter substrate-binding protein [Aureimonas altamirensis]